MAFKTIFSDELCNQLNAYYLSLKECHGLGFGGLELGTICVNILDELYATAALLKQLALDDKEPTLSGEPQGSGAPHTNRGLGRGRGGQGEGGRGRGGGQGGQGGGGGGGNGNNTNGGGGGGGGGKPENFPSNCFQQLSMTFISVPLRTTPQRPTGNPGILQRREACRSQALNFADAVETTPFLLPLFIYTGAADEVAPGEGTLYHATRHDNYDLFEQGIDPMPHRKNRLVDDGDVIEAAPVYSCLGAPLAALRLAAVASVVHMIPEKTAETNYYTETRRQAVRSPPGGAGASVMPLGSKILL
ncbi:hypothetical protein GGX14DRAFT_398212 [Mycena pura]|uniref:Uncharacterized protein n=1 Tax=Mycena pura TaxID=153505 RepID=A0AAD6VAE3_9AGAR|nr:hypothetical protein GGX14DRAFT_398212 [Mycena pura]